MPVFSFQVYINGLSSNIDIEGWVGIADRQILSFFDSVICPPHDSGGELSFHGFYYNKRPMGLDLLTR